MEGEGEGRKRVRMERGLFIVLLCPAVNSHFIKLIAKFAAQIQCLLYIAFAAFYLTRN